jgi:hypothetical protein
MAIRQVLLTWQYAMCYVAIRKYVTQIPSHITLYHYYELCYYTTMESINNLQVLMFKELKILLFKDFQIKHLLLYSTFISAKCNIK